MSSKKDLTAWQQITFKNTESITELIEQYGIEIHSEADMSSSYYYIDHFNDDVDGLNDLSLHTYHMVYADYDFFLDEDAAAGLLGLMILVKDNLEAIKAYVLEHESEHPGD